MLTEQKPFDWIFAVGFVFVVGISSFAHNGAIFLGLVILSLTIHDTAEKIADAIRNK